MTTRRRRQGQLEADVLTVLWAADHPLTPRAVQDALAGLAYTTVLTALSRLHKKGLVTRVPQLRSFLYQPTETSADFSARRMRDLLDAGNPEEVLVRFVNGLAPEEEQLLRRLLAETEGG
ncbi:MAG: BlaI/MecI/CopY family transcriptional regulator [Nocardioidaceae bacterium]